MNGVQKIQHLSRKVGEKFSFSANGETSWSFVSEGDGEIFADEKTNIASYTINGNAETLPFTLVNGIAYTIAITKTTGGQTAELNLLTRRAIDKQNIYVVPDFGAFDGRYLYVLLDNNTVLKLDSNLLTSANYIGSGGWLTTPLVSTINLPIELDLRWDHINFDNGDILVWGLITSSTTGKICRIKPDNTVRNYEDTLTDITTTLPITLNINVRTYVQSIANNYVDDLFILSPRATAGGVGGYVLDKTDLSLILLTSNFRQLGSNSFQRVYFEATTGKHPCFGDYNASENRVSNYYLINQVYNTCAYLKSSGNRYSANSNGTVGLFEFDKFGALISVRSATGTFPSINVQEQEFSVDQNNNIICGYIKAGNSTGRINYWDISNSIYRGYEITLADIELGMTGFSYPINSQYNGNHYALSNLDWNNNDNNATKKRIYIINPLSDLANINPYIGYYDVGMPNIRRIETSQYIS